MLMDIAIFTSKEKFLKQFSPKKKKLNQTIVYSAKYS